jgi:RES domain-containing protein
VDHDSLLDLSTGSVRKEAGVDLDDLACAWELIASDDGTPPSWALADRLIAQGVGGLITPSFAVGAPRDDVNIVFWDWQPERPRQVRVVDDENRLPADDLSWR